LVVHFQLDEDKKDNDSDVDVYLSNATRPSTKTTSVTSCSPRHPLQLVRAFCSPFAASPISFVSSVSTLSAVENENPSSNNKNNTLPNTIQVKAMMHQPPPPPAERYENRNDNIAAVGDDGGHNSDVHDAICCDRSYVAKAQ